MVRADDEEGRYYAGKIADFNPSKFEEYNVATGYYKIKKITNEN